jgi:glucokinase
MQAGDRTALIGDIGATHTRLAICDIDELSVNHFVVFQTKMFPSLQDALRHYLQSVPIKPRSAGFAVAGAVTEDTIAMTRAPWTFDPAEIGAACGAARIHFVNDFEAQALSLPYLISHDLTTLNEGRQGAPGNRLVLGPGSGFGCAALVDGPDTATPVYGFAGQMAFSATNARETAMLEGVADANGYAPVHDILSAGGLETVYRVLAAESGAQSDVSATDIVQNAEAGDDALAEEALDAYAAVFARIAGDMALAFNATGGVYLGGGVSPKILRTLQKPAFKKNFENKGKRSEFLSEIPLHVIMANDAGIRGAAFALSEKYPM